MHINQATQDYDEYTVRWDDEDEDEGLRDWLAQIRANDVVQVVPRAEYLGWVNYTQKMEMVIQGLETLRAPLFSPVSNRPILESTHQTDDVYYRPLDEPSKEIRLLSLKPGALDEALVCSLVTTALEDGQHTLYEALSYCWGDQNLRREMELEYGSDGSRRNRVTISITASLYSALVHLRPSDGDPRIIWVDAICINQEDYQERVKQIAIMREIYEWAEGVVVWLGEGDDESHRAMETVRTISARYEAYLASPQTPEDLQALHKPLLHENAFDAFIDSWPLFEKPYFRRTWVVQEVFNAKHAHVQCGRDLVHWKDLLRVSTCHGLTRLKATSGFRAVMPPLFARLFEHRAALPSTGLPPVDLGILEILIAGLDLDATIPQDKIFAMLQFGVETARFDELPPKLRPNYHKTTAEVFADFTRWWITHHKSLRILSALQAELGRTWQETQCVGTTVDLSNRPSWSLWYRGHSNWAKSILGLAESCRYSAGGKTEPDLDIIACSPHPTVLTLVGIQVGSINFRGPFPFFEPDDDAVELVDLYTELYDPVNEQRRWARSLFSQQKAYRKLEELPHHLMDHLRTHYEYANETHAIECHSDCFFRTTDGGLGLCVPYAREGDIITVLYGGNVPLVLRPIESTLGDETTPTTRYQLVGECYLLGYMYGKAVEDKGDAVEAFEII